MTSVPSPSIVDPITSPSLHLFSRQDGDRCSLGLISLMGLCCLICPEMQLIICGDYVTLNSKLVLLEGVANQSIATFRRYSNKENASSNILLDLPVTSETASIGISATSTSDNLKQRSLLHDLCHSPGRYYTDERLVLHPIMLILNVSY